MFSFYKDHFSFCKKFYDSSLFNSTIVDVLAVITAGKINDLCLYLWCIKDTIVTYFNYYSMTYISHAGARNIFFQASFTGVPEKGSPPCYGWFLTILMLCNFFSSASSCSIGKIALKGSIIEKISIHRQPWSFEERCSIGGWGWSCWNFEAFELCKKHSRQLNTTPPFSFFSKLSQPRLSFLKCRKSYKQIVEMKLGIC